ncbi:putative lysozyme-like protein [Thunnus thynnus]|uniref:putative lysozyme-like protein n=1 Tax=Thunnus thynnus TaxID=8237 RepID=UPI0035278BCB
MSQDFTPQTQTSPELEGRERARRARDKTCGRENAAAPLLASFRPPPKGLNTRGAPRQREQQQPEEPSPTAAGAASDPGPIFTQFSVGEAGQGGGLGARAQKNERAENMNGAVYISFFQGQLESVLEQVVQLAVQEISKSVGSSLNALLLETAVKEQEIHRLRLQLQSRENRGRGGAADGGGSAAPGKNKAGERADSGRTKPEQQQQLQLHAPGGQGIEPGVPTDTRRLEQRGRVVDQLKSVMEQVLDFAVCELTKIVEASFDDLLLEITKMEKEQHVLEERLDKSSERGGGGGSAGGGGGGGGEKGRGGGGGGGGAGGRRRGSENDSVSPSGSEDAREELTEVTESKKTPDRDDPDRPPVLSVSQDWVPILDKVFGQKWCSDVWQIKELGGDGGGGGGGGGGGSGGRSLSEGGVQQVQPLPAPSVTLEPSPSSPQQDPRWMPLEDMEVFSPDEEDSHRNAGGGAKTAGSGLSPGPPHSPTGSSGRRSSASMLHRLLTLPSQLLEDDDEAAATAKETLAALAIDAANERRDGVEPAGQTSLSPLATREEEEEEEEEEEGEEEEKGRKKKRRRVWSECEECGRRFSRVLLLKAHRQTHAADNAATDTAASPSSPPSSASALRCSECGKRFSSATRLHSHIRTQHPASRS